MRIRHRDTLDANNCGGSTLQLGNFMRILHVLHIQPYRALPPAAQLAARTALVHRRCCVMCCDLTASLSALTRVVTS